jgi:hypothetical protein
MARGSIYGRNIYGKGLYSAVRHQDVVSALNVNVLLSSPSIIKTANMGAALNISLQLASSNIQRQRPFASNALIAVGVSADLWTAHQELFSASLDISLFLSADVKNAAKLSASFEFSVNIDANPYLGPFWVDRVCDGAEWTEKDCPPNPWTTVSATTDVWDKING